MKWKHSSIRCINVYMNLSISPKMRIDPFVIKIRSQSQNVVQHSADKSTTVHVHFKVKLRQTVWFNMRFVWCDDLYWNDANKGNDDNDVKCLNILIFSKLLNILFIRHRIILKLGDIIWLTGVRGRACVCVCVHFLWASQTKAMKMRSVFVEYKSESRLFHFIIVIVAEAAWHLS